MSEGRLTPQAIELEDAILGAIMLEKEAINTTLPRLKPEYFYVEANQLVCQAMLELSMENINIDMLTVIDRLKKSNKLEQVGGPVTIAKITSKVSSAANIEFHFAIIYQKYLAREIIRISQKAISDSYFDDIDIFKVQHQMITDLESKVNHKSREPKPLNIIARETIKRISEIQESGKSIVGIDTGFATLNSIMHGWQAPDLIIIAARPSTGKTAFALNIADKIACQNVPVAFFSLEMSERQLCERMISSKSRVYANYLKKAELSEAQWDFIHRANFNIPMYIDDTPGLDILEFKEKARRLKRKHNIGAIVVDYLQLMTAMVKGNREQEISTISRSLKHIAKELDIPVIALAQLSRDVEKRKGRPILSDLRESGSIEQDADIVAFLHNPNSEDKSLQDPVIEIIYAKHRNGPTEIVELRFEKGTQTFKDL